MRRWVACRGWVALLMLIGCDDDGGGADLGVARHVDRAGRDAVVAADLGAPFDGAPDAGADGAPAVDAGARADAGSPADAGPLVDAADGPWPVTGPGPYRVGFRELEVTYAAPPDGTERTLRVATWYPTRAEEGPPARYLRGLVRRPEVLTDAPPAPGGPWPVLVFSHGSNGIAEQSYFLTERFASHGWLVVAPDHTGNTVDDLNRPIPPGMFIWRPLDLTAVLDHLAALPAGDPLAGRAGDEVVVSGHSFGGYTTLIVAGATFDLEPGRADCAEDGEGPRVDDSLCALLDDPAVVDLLQGGLRDPRVDLAIPLAPYVSPANVPDGVAAIDLPVLLVTGALDRTLPDADHGSVVWAALDGPDDLRLDFATGAHFTFANICDRFPGAGRGDGCGDSFIPPAEAHAVINTVALAFARVHLWGDETARAVIEGRVELHPDVRLTSKADN